jgi:hypothetical protein
MKFLTQLNSGCIEICRNMLKSAEFVGLNKDDFIIACLDKNAYENMKDYNGAFLYDDIVLKEYQNWSFDSNSTFRKIVKNKWKLIKEIYSNYKNLCWVDTDIVFKQNPLPIIEHNTHILFQCDIPGSYICSGFMVFNDTKACEELIFECGENTEEDDQILINTKVAKYANNCRLLDQDFFPNGFVYYRQNRKNKAIIVHNNHMVGIEEKISKFKENNMWFI